MSSSTISSGISADEFQALEQKVLRAVEIVKREREARAATERPAAIVAAKMRAVSAPANPLASLPVAVPAALNIADELCPARQSHDQIANLAGTLQSSQHSTRSRASTLAHMLDEVLEDRKVG